MSWRLVCCVCVHASVHPLIFFLLSAIETTFLSQSRPNLHKVFMGTRSQMSSIISKICPVVVVVLLLNVRGQQLWSWQDGQLT